MDVVPAKAGTYNHRLWNIGLLHKRVYARVFDAAMRGTVAGNVIEANQPDV